MGKIDYVTRGKKGEWICNINTCKQKYTEKPYKRIKKNMQTNSQRRKNTMRIL